MLRGLQVLFSLGMAWLLVLIVSNKMLGFCNHGWITRLGFEWVEEVFSFICPRGGGQGISGS